MSIDVKGSGTGRKFTVTLNGETVYESIFDFTTGTQTNEKYSYSNFKVSVPNVRGMTQAAAEEELKAYGFKVEVKTATSLNTPSGNVFMQDPSDGRTAAYGSTITITVSSGASLVGRQRCRIRPQRAECCKKFSIRKVGSVLQINGLIVKGIGGFYYVEAADAVYECKARGIFRKRKQAPLVGDSVRITAGVAEQENTIDEILPRKINCAGLQLPIWISW